MQKEDQLHKACVRWFKLQYPKKLIVHVPNGGSRNIIEAAKLKAMGTLAGVPDLLIFEENELHKGLAIELKVGKNKPKPHQLEVINLFSDRHWQTHVVYSLDQFIEVVECYFNSKPLKTA